jgi:acetyl esterase/lipase
MSITIDSQADRTVLTGAADDLERFAQVVGQARKIQAASPDMISPAVMRQAGLNFAASPLGRPGPAPESLVRIDAGGVPGVWFQPKAVTAEGRLLYFHGGGYVGGSIEASRGLAQSVANAFGKPLLAVGYRQAPEHVFPAAVDDAYAAYAWLADQPGGPITVIGDSAGATLAIVAGLEAAKSGRAPKAMIAMSGVFDMAMAGDSWTRNGEVDVVTAAMGEFFFRTYMGEAWTDAGRKDPRVAPAQASFAGASPLLLQVGSHELMLSDSEDLAAKARADGAAVTLEVYTGLPHNFSKFASPIADASLARAAAWEAAL